MNNSKFIETYEDFKQRQSGGDDPREQDHIIANVNTSEYPKELIENVEKLKEETIKLMDLRLAFLKIKRTDVMEHDTAKRELIRQFRIVNELENEFQRMINYETRDYTEEI